MGFETTIPDCMTCKSASTSSHGVGRSTQLLHVRRKSSDDSEINVNGEGSIIIGRTIVNCPNETDCGGLTRDDAKGKLTRPV